jgi:hypothetical protein
MDENRRPQAASMAHGESQHETEGAEDWKTGGLEVDGPEEQG